MGDASGGEVGQNLREMRCERGRGEVVVGVEEHSAGENERLTMNHTKDTTVGIGFGAHGTHGIHGKADGGEKAGRVGVGRGEWVGDRSLQVEFGERADALADGGEAVAAGGGEILEQVEGGQGIGFAGGDLSGRTVVKKNGEEDDEAAHERRVGVGVEVQPAIADLGGEPDGGNAAEHAVGVDAGFGRQRRVAAGAVDDEG